MRDSNGHEDWKVAMEKAEELLEQGKREMAKAAEMAQEPIVESAGARYAPMDVSRQGRHDPMVPLSHLERDELLSEFKGLVHMGLRKVAYERWDGRVMADCDKSQRPQDGWTYRCEII